jgi:TonB family protein
MPYRWVAPNGAQSVICDCALIDELRNQVIEAFLLLPRRGMEVGGLLLGRVEEHGVVHIEGFESIPCEHRYGPSFILSDDERAGLRGALALRYNGKSPTVVGLYRSYTGREPVLDAADEELIRTYFQDPHAAFLLIRPQSPTECTATFLFWDRDGLPTRPRYPLFPLDGTRLNGALAPPVEAKPVVRSEPGPEPVAQPEPASVAEPEAAAQPEPEPEPVAQPEPASAAEPEAAAQPEPVAVAPDPAPPIDVPFASYGRRRSRLGDDQDEDEQSSHRKRVWLLPVCATLLIGAAFAYQYSKLASEPRWSDLGLDAQGTAGEVQVRWNGSAPALEHATRATLTIADGADRKTIQMSSASLHSGNFAYRPTGHDLLFRLEFDTGSQHAVDSIRFVTVVAAPPAPVPEVATVEPKPEPKVPPAAKPSPPAVQPVPIHPVQPVISAGIRSRIQGRIVVPVAVKVSASGAVTSATSSGSGDGLHRYLATEAVKAARKWSFSPARSRDGKAVIGQKTIYFTFTR